MRPRQFARRALLLVAASTLAAAGWARADPPAGTHAVLQEYVTRAKQREAVVARVRVAFGRPFTAFTDEDYAAFLAGLDLKEPEDLWTWSHVTNVPVLALSQGRDFLRANAHLLADAQAAREIPTEELRKMTSRVRGGKLTVTSSSGQALEIRADAVEAVRATQLTAQIRHNPDFAEDASSPALLHPCLVRLEDIPYRAEVAKALRALPLSIVKVLCGKALYLTTRDGGRCDAIWHCAGSELNASFAGMQPGILVEAGRDGKTVEGVVRALSRLVRETVLESQYFGIYAHPLQFPAFQRLQPERRRLFGRRRDKLPHTPYGYVNERALRDAQENFGEHLTAYLLERDSFLRKAEQQRAQGHPQLMRKFDFMQTLVERTPAAMERLSQDRLAWFDAGAQREILNEYKARQAASGSIRARVEQTFGKPFPEFTREDYAAFMNGLDLDDDDDLWTWSHVTDIPVVAIDKRSNFFHMNAHLLADVRRANLMSWHDLHDLVTRYDRETRRITIQSGKTRRSRTRSASCRRTPFGTWKRRTGSDTTKAGPRIGSRTRRSSSAWFGSPTWRTGKT